MLGNATIKYLNKIGDINSYITVKVNITRLDEDELGFTCEGMEDCYLDLNDDKVYTEGGVFIGKDASIIECDLYQW